MKMIDGYNIVEASDYKNPLPIEVTYSVEYGLDVITVNNRNNADITMFGGDYRPLKDLHFKLQRLQELGFEIKYI